VFKVSEFCPCQIVAAIHPNVAAAQYHKNLVHFDDNDGSQEDGIVTPMLDNYYNF
jgi:hypothetical protein